LELEGLLGRRIESERSLLFLDEIQATPYALAALRYFYEERPELPVIVAGSLLEFTLAKHAFSMPVGRVEYHHIGPVSFSEFIACADSDLNPWREAAARLETVPESAHRRLLSRMREYFYNLSREERAREVKACIELLNCAQICQKVVASHFPCMPWRRYPWR